MQRPFVLVVRRAVLGVSAVVVMFLLNATPAAAQQAHAHGHHAGHAVATPESAATAAAGAAAMTGGLSRYDFFTNYGHYMPRVHCLLTPSGQPDWPWIGALLVLNVVIIVGYLRIFMFWRKSYLAEAPQDRNKKLMNLAFIFLTCAICGYAMSIVMFVWPAYRLLAIMLAVLAFFTWRFNYKLGELKVSLSAKRLQRELADALAARNAELERVVKERTVELQRAKAAADDASQCKSDFVAHMSHEMRTPLTAILGFAQLLERSNPTEDERKEWLQTIQRNGKHLLSLINDVLDLTKIESGKMEYEKAWCSPHAMLSEVLSMLRVSAKEKGLSLDLHYHSPLPERVLTDPTRVRQVLINLLGNAVKFTERGGIRITAAMDAGRLCVRVTDTGVGIPPGKLEHVFEAFTQADNTVTRRFGGTGLGLTISRRICRELGGDLQVQSCEGVGSTFSLLVDAGPLDGIPLVSPDRVSEAVQAASADKPASPTTLGGAVLVVDDGPTNRKLIALLLERAGATVATAEHGEAALRAVKAQQFDAILMDMQMPVMDGYTAAAELRARGYTRPIIALTANAMRGDRERCMLSGCSGYLSKPIDPDMLIATVAEALHTNCTLPAAPAPEPAPMDADAKPAATDAVVVTCDLPLDDPEIREIVAAFPDRLDEQLAKMRAAVEEGGAGACDELARLAHWLKGTGGTCGIHAFTEPAARLEAQAKAGELAAIRASVDELTRLAAARRRLIAQATA